jgi:hypothetical protein
MPTTLFLQWGVAMGLGLVYVARYPNLYVAESWRSNIYNEDKLANFGWIIFWACALALVAIAVVEYRLKKGWEPAALQKMRPAMTVVSIYPQSNGSGNADVTLRDPRGGHEEVFEAEPHEWKELEVGEAYHMRVIGKYVCNFVKLNSPTPATPFGDQIIAVAVNELRLRAMASRPPGCVSWGFFLIVPLIAGYFAALGMILMLFREWIAFGGEREWVSRDGSLGVIGLFVFLFSLGLVFMVARLAIHGFNLDEQLEQIRYDSKDSDYSLRRNLW